MYRVLPKNEQIEYTFAELKEAFDGKWVYLVRAVFNDAHGLMKASPVVVADSELEGVEDDVYTQFHSADYGNTADVDFTDMCTAFPSVLWSERV
jgi:hypothetical protein